MNYIKRLQAENQQLKQQLKAAHDATMELYSYCGSDKFKGPSGYGGPTYINKNDIFHRLEPIFKELNHD